MLQGASHLRNMDSPNRGSIDRERVSAGLIEKTRMKENKHEMAYPAPYESLDNDRPYIYREKEKEERRQKHLRLDNSEYLDQNRA